MNQNEDAPWQYKPDDSPDSAPDEPVGGSEAQHHPKSRANFSWESAEFIEQHHGPGWYSGLIAVTALVAAIIYVTTKGYFATGVIVVLGIIIWFYAGQKPSKASYEITSAGLSINGKNYPFSVYKSFAIMHEGSLSSVSLIPLKRFKPPVTAYFDPKDEDKVTEALGEYIPYEERSMDTVDKISRRLRL